MGANSVTAFDTETQQMVKDIPELPDVHGVLVVPALRKVYATAAVMPLLTAPKAHMATTAPVQLKWMPLGLKAVPGVMTADLSVTAWISTGGGSGQTDGYLKLDDAAGQATWNAGNTKWTSIELQGHTTFGKASEEISYSFFLPVN